MLHRRASQPAAVLRRVQKTLKNEAMGAFHGFTFSLHGVVNAIFTACRGMYL